MKTGFSVVAMAAVIGCLLLGANPAAATSVYNSVGEYVGEFHGNFDNDPGLWVVYNPTLDRLLIVESFTGMIDSPHQSPLEGCPYFDTGSSCTAQAFVDLEWVSWITECGPVTSRRYFRATTVQDSVVASATDRLTTAGACVPESITENVRDVYQADELQETDLPFTFAGPLEVRATVATQQVMSVDAMSPGGLAVLAALLVASGIFLMRRLS